MAVGEAVPRKNKRAHEHPARRHDQNPGALSAVHLATGDPAMEASIDAWLESHGVQVTRLTNVLAFCVHLVRHRDQPPALCIVGLDWLEPEDLAILGYIRQGWPDTSLIVYGRPPATGPVEASGGLWCPSEADLRHLVGREPQSFPGSRGAARSGSAKPPEGRGPDPLEPPSAHVADPAPPWTPVPVG